jgi:hypothetical protein
MTPEHEQAHKRASKPKRSGRTTALAGLLALVGVLAVWLSDCIPGFGIGSRSDGDGEAERAVESEQAEPVEAEPEPPEPAEGGQAAEGQPSVRKPVPMKLTIDARGCIVEGGEPIDCAAMCDRDELFEGIDSVIIDATNGPHGVVMDVLDCLKTKKLSVALNRK